MHQTRQEATTRLPLPRKGTKYLARAADHSRDAVPIVIALRDMLKFATTAREVREMIKQKLLKINGRTVIDLHESIQLFNLLEADKQYKLTLAPQGKFVFKELKKPEDRLAKIVGKRLVTKGKIQLNLHDGTNVLTSDKSISVGGSVYLDEKNRVKSYVPLEKGRDVFVISGKHQGKIGKITNVDNGEVTIQSLEATTVLKANMVVVLK